MHHHSRIQLMPYEANLKSLLYDTRLGVEIPYYLSIEFVLVYRHDEVKSPDQGREEDRLHPVCHQQLRSMTWGAYWEYRTVNAEWVVVGNQDHWPQSLDKPRWKDNVD